MSSQDDAAQDEKMPGSFAADQAKTEPMPPSPGHADPDAAPEPTTAERPDLDSMNVGATDPQAPSHDSAGGHADRGRSGVPALETPVFGGSVPGDQKPSPDLGSSTGRDLGPEMPVQTTDGTARRAPGSNGETPAGEQIETDMERSAQNTNVNGTPGTRSGPGDAGGVPVTSGEPAPGTSQETDVAQGPRTPL